MKVSITTLIPVIDETYSLKQTVDIVEDDSGSAILEHLILVHPQKTKQGSLDAIEELKEKYGAKIKIVEQELPYVGGAVRKGFDLAKGTHCILLSSDLETDPALAKHFIENVKKEPNVLFTANRWIKNRAFKGYSPLKLVLNYIFQKIIAIMYYRNFHDFTFGYRIFRVDLVQKIKWEGLKHPFFIETILKPIRLGVEVKELPTKWVARTEGESQNTFFTNFLYLNMALKIRFAKKESLLK